jgi:hypothetical protein
MFLISIRRFNLARFYLKKGLEYAEEAKFDPWILNIHHLVLRMEICQNNRNEAKDATVSALECAKKLNIDCLVKIKSHDFASVVPNNAGHPRSNLFYDR